MRKLIFTSFITFLCVLSQAQIPTNGLVGYWPFNGNANDESGNGHNGTVNGATLTSDRFGRCNAAYYFDGAAKISVPDHPDLNIPSGKISISVWVYKIGSDTTGHILGKRTVRAKKQQASEIANVTGSVEDEELASAAEEIFG